MIELSLYHECKATLNLVKTKQNKKQKRQTNQPMGGKTLTINGNSSH